MKREWLRLKEFPETLDFAFLTLTTAEELDLKYRQLTEKANFIFPGRQSLLHLLQPSMTPFFVDTFRHQVQQNRLHLLLERLENTQGPCKVKVYLTEKEKKVICFNNILFCG